MIHISSPGDETRTNHAQATHQVAALRKPIARARSPALGRAKRSETAAATEQRRFHLSRSALAAPDTKLPQNGGPSKRGRSAAAVFVERNRKKMAQRAHSYQASPTRQGDGHTQPAATSAGGLASGREFRTLKKPSSMSRLRASPSMSPSRPAPLPLLPDRHLQDMNKIADEMNKGVMHEIGVNLHNMERERERERKQQEAAKLRLRPKAPAQRYSDRQQHSPQTTRGTNDNNSDGMSKGGLLADSYMSEGEDEEGDWIIDEYIRIPVTAMSMDAKPGEIGLLVLEGEDDNVLFFSPEHDDEDDLDADEEDENGKPPPLLVPTYHSQHPLFDVVLKYHVVNSRGSLHRRLP